MRHLRTNFLRIVTPLSLLLWGIAAKAQFLSNDSLYEIGNSAYGDRISTPLPVLIGSLVKVFIGALGIIFLLLTIYAGYLYLTARGDSEKVEHAKETLQRGVIGLVIITAAYAIAAFVINALLASTSPTP